MNTVQETVSEYTKLLELQEALHGIMRYHSICADSIILQLPSTDWRQDVCYLQSIGLLHEASLIQRNYDIWSNIAAVIHNVQ